MKRNRIVAAILAIGLSMSVQITSFAGTTYSEGYLYYEIADEAVIITGYFGPKETVRIPEKIAGYPVSEIAKGAFSGDTSAKTVYLPETIMTIEDDAFGDGVKVVYSDGETAAAKNMEAETTAGQSGGNNAGKSGNPETESNNKTGSSGSSGSSTLTENNGSSKSSVASQNSGNAGSASQSTGSQTVTGQTSADQSSGNPTAENIAASASNGAAETMEEKEISNESQAVSLETAQVMLTDNSEKTDAQNTGTKYLILIPVIMMLIGAGIYTYIRKKR